MTCSLCSKPALYRAAEHAYCKDHYAEAKAESIRLGSTKTGKGPTC